MQQLGEEEDREHSLGEIDFPDPSREEGQESDLAQELLALLPQVFGGSRVWVLAAVCGGTLLALLFQTGLIWPLLVLIVIGGIVYFQMSVRGSAVLPLDPQEEMLAEDLHWKRTGLLAQIETLDDIQLLTGRQFEVVVADLLQELGYTEITRVGGSGDLCVDIKAVGSNGKQVAVQCKRYGAKKKVSSTEMQTFIGMIYVQHKADRGLYVTTSSYTKVAYNLAKGNTIELIDGERLMKIIRTGSLDLA